LDYWLRPRYHTVTWHPLENLEMSIGTFLEEIENNKKKKLKDLSDRLSRDKAALQGNADLAIKDATTHYSTEATIRSEQEATRIIEAAKLQAKKIIFEAVNVKMDSIFAQIKTEIADYTKTPEYKNTLKKMALTAQRSLGKNIGIGCKEEDRSSFNDLGVNVTKTISTIGGLTAENMDRTMELDLTFEELLRIHEDEIRATIMEAFV
jgi:V/A-type H+/Na+-transporting ATPase subunit E